jgi:hypothetical protein
MKFKKIERSKEYETHSRTICDFCQKETRSSDYYDASEVEIAATLGEIYPEGDSRQCEEFDCCPSCWTAKVRPALEALGGKVHVYRYEDGRTHTMPLDPVAKDEP